MRKKYCFPIFSALFSAIFSANVYAQDCSGLVLQQDGNLCERVNVIVSNPDCFERYTYKVTELLSDGTEDVEKFENVNESSKEVVFGTATESFSVTVSAFAQGSPDAVEQTIKLDRLTPSPEVAGYSEQATIGTMDLSDLVTPAAGSSLRWYSDLTGGTISTPVVDLNKPGTTVYYVSQIVVGCESARKPIKVEILPPAVPEPPETRNFTDCASDTPLDLTTLVTASGDGSLRFYDVQTGGTSLASPVVDISTAADKYYYVSQVVDGRESERAQILVRILEKPVAFAGDDVSVCQGSVVQLGAAPQTGLLYSWAPSGFLQSPNAANPQTLPSLSQTTTFTLQVRRAATRTEACTATDDVVVTVVPKPSATVMESSLSICSGNSAELCVAAEEQGVSYSWQPANMVQSPSAACTNSAVLSADQQFILTASNSAMPECYSTATVDVKVGNMPGLDLGDNVSVCRGATAEIGIEPQTGVSYSWQPAGMVTDPSSAKTTTVALQQATTFTLTAVSDHSPECKATASVLVSVEQPPYAFTLSGGGTACEGSTQSGGYARLQGSNSLVEYMLVKDGDETTGTWMAGTGLPLEWDNLAPGTYTVKARNTFGSRCEAYMTGTVSVYEVPVPSLVSFSAAAGTVCPGSAASITLQFDGEAPFSFDLLVNGYTRHYTSRQNTYTFQITPVAATTNVILSAFSDANCTTVLEKPDTVSVVLDDLSSYGVKAEPSTIVCPGNDVKLSSIYTGDNVSYIWSTGETTSSITVAPAATTEYRLTTITPAGCIANDTVDIAVSPVPELEITGLNEDSSYCYSDPPFQLYASVPGGVYSSEPETDAVTSGGYVDPSKAVQGGEHVITYSYTDENGCETSTTFSIYLYPAVPVDWYVEPDYFPYGDSYAFCLPNEDQLQSYFLVGVPTSTEQNGRWTLHSTEQSDTYLTNATGGTTSMVNLTPGSYSVTYSITDHAGCVNSKTKSIDIRNQVTQIIDNDSIWMYPKDTICLNTCNEAYIQASNERGVFSISGNMEFTVDPVVPTRAWLCPEHTGSQGSFTAIYTMDDGYGCQTRFRKDFYVRGSVTIPRFNLEDDYCEDDEDTQIKVIASSPVSGTINIYRDGDPDDLVVESLDPDKSRVLFRPSWGEGEYTIEYTYDDGYCENVYTQIVSVHASDEITFNLDNDYCLGDVVRLSALPFGGSFSSSVPEALANNVLYTEEAGVGSITLTYNTVNEHGCASSDTHEIEVRGYENTRIDNLLDEYCEPRGEAVISAYPTYPGTGVFTGGSWLTDNGDGTASIDLSQTVRSNTYRVTYSYSQDYPKSDGTVLTCSSSAIGTFKVLDKTATIRGIADNENICGTEQPFLIYGYPYDDHGRGHFEFSLTPAGGFKDNGDGTATITPSALSDDTYGITYIYEYMDEETGDILCTTQTSVTFTVTAMPVLANPEFVCSPDGQYPVMVVKNSLVDTEYTMNLSNGAVIETLQGTGGDLQFKPVTFNSYLMLTADRNGCVSRLADNIHVSPLAITEVVAQNLKCNESKDGMLEVEVSGGGYPYNHLIEPQNGLAAIQDSIAYNLPAGIYLYSVSDSMGCSINDRPVTLTEPTPVQASLSSTDLLCFENNGGNVVANVSGGTSPYTYEWYKHPDMVTVVGRSAALTGVGAGDYQLVVADRNGCVPANASELIATLTQPDELEITLRRKVDVVTTGAATGSIDISVSGGVEPYTYNWVGGNIDASTKNQQDQTGLVAGTYYVSVTDANGCTSATLSVTIDEPRNLRVRSSVTDISCFGRNDGRIVLIIEGGHGPFVFSWKDESGSEISDQQNVSGLAAGIYTLDLVDTYTQLVYHDTFIISEPSLLTTTVLSTSTVSLNCYGDEDGNVDINVNGGVAPYDIEWLGLAVQPDDPLSARNLPSGAYTVSVTDANGCHAGAEWVISQPSEMTLAMQLTQNRCHGGTEGAATLEYGGGVEPYSIAWTGAGIDNPSDPDQSGLWAGNTYTVTLTDANGCRKQLSTVMENPTLMEIEASVSDVVCNNSGNGSASLAVVGGKAPYTYKWTDETGSHVLSSSASISGLVPGTYNYEVSDNLGCVHYGDIAVTEPDVLSVSIQKTDISCFGYANGTATAVVSGGTAPYKYEWTGSDGNIGDTPSVSALAKGTYSLLVTDANGCMAGASAVINEPQAISLSYEITDVSSYGGNDGAIEIVHVQGGTGAGTYSFNWSGGNVVDATAQNQTGLVADEYFVTVTDANSCTASESMVVSQPERLDVEVEINDVLCNGASDGSIIVTSVSGGVLPYSYEWTSASDPAFAGNQRNLNNAAAGTYRLTVTDAVGDTFRRSYTVSEPEALSLAFNNSDMQVPCYGDKTAMLRINLSGGTPAYTVKWQGPDIDPAGNYEYSASGLGAGTYSVFATDSHGCTISANAQIRQNPQISVDAEITDNVCHEDANGSISLSVSGGTGDYSFVWNGSGLADPSAMDQTGLSAGTYTVSVSDGNSCTVVETYEITSPGTLDFSVEKTDVSCSGAADGSLVASATGGVPPYSYKWTETATGKEISDAGMNALTPGIYSLEITDAAGCVKTGEYEITGPSALSASISLSPMLCAGAADGTAAVYVAQGSGTAPYVYEWKNQLGETIGSGASLSNLAPGTYSVSVTDANGCSIELRGTISEASPIQIYEEKITNVTNTGSFTGAIDLTVRGGSGSYVYSWVKDGVEISNDLDMENLAAGWYYLTVTDDNGCAAYYEVEITEPRALEVDAVVVQNSCKGDNNAYIELTVQGGADHSYSWQKDGTPYSNTKDIYNLAPGYYTVTINYTGDDLPYVRTFEITEPEELVVSTLPSSITGISCEGAGNGSINIEVTGGTTAYNVSWSGNGLPAIINNPFSVSPLGPGIYRVDVSDANGCVANETVEITSPSSLELSADITRNTCYGAYDGAIDITVTGGTPPYVYRWTGVGVDAASEDQSGLRGGTYDLTVTDANACSISRRFTLNDPAPGGAVISGGGHICTGGTTSFKIAMSGMAPFVVEYTDGHDIFTKNADASELEIEVSPSVNTVYKLVSLVDANGCEGTLDGQAEVLVHPYPSASIVKYNEDCCLGETVAVELLATNEGPWTLTYENASGMQTVTEIDSENSEIALIPAKEGLNSYRLVSISNEYCTTSLDEELTITAYPEPTLQVEIPHVACVGDEMDIILTTTGQGPWMVSYNENGSDFTININESPYTLPLSPMQEETLLTFTSVMSGNHCVNELANHEYTIEAGLPPYQPARIEGNNAVCRNSSERYRVAPVGNADTYVWTLPQGWTIASGFGTNDIWVNIAPDASSGMIRVHAENECGVGLETSLAVETDKDFGPLGQLHSPVYVCQRSSMFQLSVDPVEGAEHYEWTLPEGYTIVSGDLSPNIIVEIDQYAVAGMVTVVPYNRCAEAGTISGYVNIRKLPFAEAGADFATECLDYAQLAAGTADSITGFWTSMRSSEIAFDDNTLPNASVSNLVFGENPFRWEVTDGYCINYDSVSVYNYNPGITMPEVEMETLCADSFLLSAPVPLYGDYRWTLIAGDGEIENPASNETMIRELSIKTPNVIRWEVYSAACSNTVDVTLVSHSLDRLAYAGEDTTIVDDFLGLQAKLVSDENVSGKWTVVAGAGEFDDPSSPITTVRGLAPGVNTLRWTLTGYGCEAWHEIKVTTVDEPVAGFTADITEGCRPLTVTFTNRTLGEAVYSWNFDDGNTSSAMSPTHVFENSGLYEVKLVAIGENRTDSATMRIYVYPHLDPEFYAANTQLYLPAADAHFFDNTEGATSYYWDFGDSATSEERNPVHRYEEKGFYDVKLVVTNEYGCLDSLVVEEYISVDNDGFVVFPNAFTPDLTQANGGHYELNERRLDIFYPASRNVDEYKLEIYNQWGVKVFESNDINTGWDGYYLGKCAAQGTYSYLAEGKYKNGVSFRYSGSFLLIR